MNSAALVPAQNRVARNRDGSRAEASLAGQTRSRSMAASCPDPVIGGNCLSRATFS